MEILRTIDDDHIVYLGRQFVSFQRVGVLMDKWKEDQMGIVRCKDCKHREQYQCNHIMLGNTKCGVTDDWFCADGERREDGKAD